MEPEAEADAERRDEPLDVRPTDADGVKREHGAQGDQGVLSDRRHRVAKAGVHLASAGHRDFEQTREVLRSEEGQREEQCAREEAAGGDAADRFLSARADAARFPKSEIECLKGRKDTGPDDGEEEADSDQSGEVYQVNRLFFDRGEIDRQPPLHDGPVGVVCVLRLGGAFCPLPSDGETRPGDEKPAHRRVVDDEGDQHDATRGEDSPLDFQCRVVVAQGAEDGEEERKKNGESVHGMSNPKRAVVGSQVLLR